MCGHSTLLAITMGTMRDFGRVAFTVGVLTLLAGCGDDGMSGQGGAAGQASSAGQTSVAGSASNPGPTAGSSAVGMGGTNASSAGASGSSHAGSSSAGSATTGGSSSGGSGSGMAGSGSGGGAGGGGVTPMNKVFSQCRLHFGTIDSKAKENAALIPELDFFTPGWMGQSDTFDQKFVCDEAKEGAVLGKQVPVVVAYVSAFYVKRHHGGLCDCNVSTCGQVDGKPNDLCHFGSQYIQQDLAAITNVYKSYAQGYAGCFGTTRPIIFEMEPDFYQYTGNTQTDPMTKDEAAKMIDQYVTAMKQYLPNAYFSLDVSPWVDDNGASNGKDWFSHFDLSLFTFVNTSGGSTQAATSKIRNDNMMTWAGVSQVTGKAVLADTGYGANGVSAGHDANWDDVNNLNARLADGVVSISQYNPKSDWANTIKTIRSQLKTPKFCP
jgi:hypothetical protein